jgi:hypothetical protein
MKRWGIIVTACYAVLLVGCLLIGLEGEDVRSIVRDARTFLALWATILLGGQALLLFLSVDTSQRKLTPRRHILVSAATAAVLVALLTHAFLYALLAGIKGDHMDTVVPGVVKASGVYGLLAVLWGAWMVVFWRYARGGSLTTTRIVGWLLKGSVLELLVAVPCHVWTRRRDDCSAPAVTGYGIATGLAIMLLSFGPSVLFLYKKRLEQHPARRGARP